jgi:hypothetical protein
VAKQTNAPKEPLCSRVEPIKGVPYIFVTEGGLEESPGPFATNIPRITWSPVRIARAERPHLTRVLAFR